MSNRLSHIPITVKPIDGGWVSYVDPQKYPKAHFGDTKPFYAPKNLEKLTGPDSGMIKLPLHLYWGPKKWFNLLHRSALRIVYQTVLEEGALDDFELYLNRDVLNSIWDDLCLPPRITQLWETRVEGLKHG